MHVFLEKMRFASYYNNIARERDAALRLGGWLVDFWEFDGSFLVVVLLGWAMAMQWFGGGVGMLELNKKITL